MQAATAGLTNHSGIYLARLHFVCDILNCDVYQLLVEAYHLQIFYLQKMLLRNSEEAI